MGLFKYLSPRNLKTELHRFGYHFSLAGYLRYLACALLGVMSVAYLLRLSPPFILTVGAGMVLMVPGLFVMTYRNLYEDKKFEDITAYMEQLLYSFQRRAKILTALEDTLVLFRQGELHDVVSRAIRHIQNANTKGNIYREAFAFIEGGYGCKRLRKIHEFLIRVEGTGGDFSNSIEILLEDRRLWIERVYALKKDKKNVKIKTTIGIGLSLLLCGMCVMMLPKDFGITDMWVSQAAATAVLLLDMLIWYAAQAKLSGSLLEDEAECNYEEVRKQYEYVMHGDRKKEKKKAAVSALLFIPVIIAAGIRFGIPSAVFAGFIAAALAAWPGRKYRYSLKRVTKEVEKVFPEWLMGMSLQLQTDNVHVSLSKSIPDAPPVLKEELYMLEEGINEHPEDVKPYIDFMRNLDLPDVMSAMKMLYSMAEFGADDSGCQIGALVKRNAVMTDKAERLRAEDYITGMSFLVLLPMVTGVIKMLSDLVLVVLSLISVVNTV